MEEKIITVFCLVDDLLRVMDIKDDVRAKICNAEINNRIYGSEIF